MKQIKPVSIWDKGTIYKAEILNIYATNLQLNKSAEFYYSLFTKNENGQVGLQVAQGNLPMNEEEYSEWTCDEYVWNFATKKLNLEIIGDWVDPVIKEIESK